jgi:hypothetical protein
MARWKELCKAPDMESNFDPDRRCQSIPSGGSPEATRRAFNKRFLLDLAEDWQQHGREVFKRVRRESPASYLKVCSLLVPREMKVEHSNPLKGLTDEQLEIPGPSFFYPPVMGKGED